MIAFVLIAAQAVAAATPAQLPTIFGLQLGAPVTLPECVHTDLGGGHRSKEGYDQSQDVICQGLPGVELPSINSGSVRFPVAKLPAIIGVNRVSTEIEGGTLQGIYAATLSYNSAPKIVDDLSAKFGPPTSREADTALIDKIPVPCIHVIWRRPGFTVDYRSIESDIDHGYLQIETDAARIAHEVKDHARDTERTPL